MVELSEKLTFTLDQELGVAGGDGNLDEVQVLPSGKVVPKGKADFLVDGEARGIIISAFDKSATDLVVDYEHQSLSGSEAPAAGWIKGLEDRGAGGIWARVQWTERAKEYLKNREYRYLSPVVLIRKKDGRAVELLGAALTNLPAIDGMKPVVNTNRPLEEEEVKQLEENYRELYCEVLKLAGLPEDAGMDEVREKFAAMSSPEGFVPLSVYEALEDTVKTKEAEAMIKEALSDGRITPALLPWARSYAINDPEGFSEFMGKASPVVPLGSRDKLHGPIVDQAQKAVNSLLGISDDIFLRYGRTAEVE